MPDGDQGRRLSYQELGKALGRTPCGTRPNGPEQANVPVPNDAQSVLLMIRETVELLLTPLGEQLTVANRCADSAEQRADRERERADSAAQQLAAVETELVSARVEAARLRCKLAEAASSKPAPRRSRWLWRWP